MTLLIDALNKAEKDNKKLNISFADDDEYIDKSESNNNQQKPSPVEPIIKQETNNHETHKNTNQSNISASSPITQAAPTIPPVLNTPQHHHQSTRENSKFKISMLFTIAILLLLAGSAIYWYLNNPNDRILIISKTNTSVESQEELEINSPKPDTSISENSILDNYRNQEPIIQENVSVAKPEISNNQTIEEVKVVTNQPLPKQQSYSDFEKVVIEKSRKPVSNQLNLAAQQLKKKNYLEAENIYQSVLKHQPSNIEALQNLGVIAYNQGQNQQAKKYFEKVLTLNPNNRFANNVINAIQGLNGRTTNNVGDNKNPAQLNFIQGTMNAEKGQWSAARNQYARALAYEQKNPDYAYNLAVACDNLGDLNCAYRYYRMAIQNSLVQPGHFSSNLVRARIAQISRAVQDSQAN